MGSRGRNFTSEGQGEKAATLSLKRKEEATFFNPVEPKAVSWPYLCTWPATAARGTWFSTVTLKERGDSGVGISTSC